MGREHPGCPFERYADDVVIHCDGEDQARKPRAAIACRCRGPPDRADSAVNRSAVAW